MGSLGGIPPDVDLCQIPLGSPPDGQQSDFNNGSVLKPLTISLSVIITSIAVIIASGRIYGNIRRFGWSDFFVICCMCLNPSLAGTMIGNVKFFRHMWDAPLCWINGKFEEISYVWQILYCFSLFFAKSATLMLFIQLFKISKPMKIAIWVGLGVNIAITASSIITLTYFAAPRIGETWDELIFRVRGTVIFSFYWAVAQGAVGSVLDVYLFILPLPAIYRLQLSMRKKIQLIALFFVGLLGIIASLISLVYRVKSIQGEMDQTYVAGVLVNCNLAELNAALIVCSTPAFSSFMRSHVMNSRIYKMISSYTSSSQSENESQGARLHSDPNRPRTGRFNRSTGQGTKDSGYVEMGDAWLLKSNIGAAAEISSPKNAPLMDEGNMDGFKVYRVVDIEQSHKQYDPVAGQARWAQQGPGRGFDHRDL